MTNPKLRFIGKKNFSDDWLSITFSENFNFIAGKALSRAQLSEEGAVRNVHYGDILIKLPSVVDVSKDVLPYVDASVDVSKVPRLQSGDILFADAAEDLTAGKAVELKHCEGKPVIAGLHTIACRTKEIFASGFLGYYLNSPAFHRQLITLLVGTKVYSLSKNQLLKVSLSKPSIAEQQKIADFFTALDEKITLAERKLTTLQTLKSGLMQKIFSREIRFKHEDGSDYSSWTLKNLGDVCSTFKSGVSITSKQIFEEGQYAVYGGNGLRGYTGRYTHEGEFLLVGRQGALCGNVRIVTGRNFISEHAIAIQASQGSSTRWLMYLLDWMNLNKLSESSAQPGLSVSKLVNIQCEIPCLQEQKKITRVLSCVDKKIALCGQMLGQLRMQKQAFLQQMFV